MLIEWVSYLGDLENNFGNRQLVEALLGSVLKELFSSAYMRPTCGSVVGQTYVDHQLWQICSVYTRSSSFLHEDVRFHLVNHLTHESNLHMPVL